MNRFSHSLRKGTVEFPPDPSVEVNYKKGILHKPVISLIGVDKNFTWDVCFVFKIGEDKLVTIEVSTNNIMTDV
jgi:hypothetical protein